jgi:O-antigen ligase
MNSTYTGSYSWSGASDSFWGRGIAGPLLVAAQVAYVLFLSAGHFKANPGLAWIPFDLTVATGCLVLVLSIMSFIAAGERIRGEIFWIVTFFAAMAIAALWTEWTPYALEKATRFYSLTFLAAVLPAFILTELKDAKRFVSLVIAFGIVISSGVLVQLVRGGFTGGLAERTAGFATVTTALGWDAGQALVGLYACMLRGGKWIWLALVCLPLFLVVVASGARGPLFIAVLVIGFLTIRFSQRMNVGLGIALVLVLSAWLVLTQYSSILPQGSTNRIIIMLQGRNDVSAQERAQANLAALEAIERYPFGMGFGGFARVYNFGNITDRVYPHNLVLEIAAENGLFVAILFVGIAGLALRRSYQTAVVTPEIQPLFAMLLFVAANSIVSGELNADRLLYVLIAAGLQLPALNAHATASDLQG